MFLAARCFLFAVDWVCHKTLLDRRSKVSNKKRSMVTGAECGFPAIKCKECLEGLNPNQNLACYLAPVNDQHIEEAQSESDVLTEETHSPSLDVLI